MDLKESQPCNSLYLVNTRQMIDLEVEGMRKQGSVAGN